MLYFSAFTARSADGGGARRGEPDEDLGRSDHPGQQTGISWMSI